MVKDETLLSIIRDEVSYRVKTPYLVSLILCYVSVNRVGVINFYFGSEIERKVIMSNFTYIDLDILYALFLLFVYIFTTKFALPLLGLGIDKLKYHYVIKERQRMDAYEKISFYHNLEGVNKAKYESGPEYIKKVIDNEVESWVHDKKALFSEFDRVRHLKEEAEFEIATLKSPLNKSHETLKDDTVKMV